MVFRPRVAARWPPSVAPIELFRLKQKQFRSDSLPVSHDCAIMLGREVQLVWPVTHQSERIPLAKLACHTWQSVQAPLIRILSSEYVIAAKLAIRSRLRCENKRVMSRRRNLIVRGLQGKRFNSQSQVQKWVELSVSHYGEMWNEMYIPGLFLV